MADDTPTVFRTDYPPDRTPAVGLAFTGDSVMNANLARIDAALAELKGDIPPPVEEPPAADSTLGIQRAKEEADRELAAQLSGAPATE